VQVSGTTVTSFTTGVHAVMADEAIAGEDGVAHLSVLDGSALASSYRMSVVPPAASPFGIIFGSSVPLTSATTSVRLPPRLSIGGKIVDSTGRELAGVSVTARRSLRFLWSLEDTEQAFLNEISAATTTTEEDGNFLLWVDPAVGSAWGHYDIYFEPPEGSTAPRWTIPDFEIPRIPDQTAISLDTVTIPDAAYLHGKIVDGAGRNVLGSTLRLFLLSPDDSVCQEVFNAPEECADDAKVMGQAQSDDNGIVRIKLPRP